MTSFKCGTQGACTQGQLVHSGSGRPRKKTLTGEKTSLPHTLESSLCLAQQSWWQLHMSTTHTGMVLRSLMAGLGPRHHACPEQPCLRRWPTHRTELPGVMLTARQFFTSCLFPGVLPWSSIGEFIGSWERLVLMQIHLLLYECKFLSQKRNLAQRHL